MLNTARGDLAHSEQEPRAFCVFRKKSGFACKKTDAGASNKQKGGKR